MPGLLGWLLRLVLLNPICIRLVQGGSRRQRHNLIRSGYLAVLIGVLLVRVIPQQGLLQYQTLAVSGAAAFEIVAYLQIALICILAPVFMAGAIAQESNPRTWEVLLTTPLSAGQMVLGHLFGRLFFVIGLLVASLPLFALTQFFGGVPGRSILLSSAIAACAALLVGAVAVALAVNRLAGRRAVFAFYVSVVTYLAVTIAIDSALRPGGGVTLMTALNPFLALRSLLNPAGYPRPDAIELASMGTLPRLWLGDPVLAWCLLSVGISVLLMVVSTMTVRAVGIAGAGGWFRRAGGGSRSGGRAGRTVWHNPVAWREAAARQVSWPKLVLRWSFIGAGALWGVALLAFFHGEALAPDDFRFALLATIWTELIVIVLVAINVSATAISREREDGTLDLLMTTPITPSAYLGGKLRGLISYLTPLLGVPLGTLGVTALYVLLDGLGRPGGVMVQDVLGAGALSIPLVLPEAALVAPVVVLPFTAFCVMLGLQWSMKSKGTISSVIATVAIVGVVASIVGLCGWQAGATIPIIGPALASATPVTFAMTAIQTARALDHRIDGAQGLVIARWSLAGGAVVAGLVYALVVYGIHANMVKTFDMAVRRLAGSR